jgi:hypothetical protein
LIVLTPTVRPRDGYQNRSNHASFSVVRGGQPDATAAALVALGHCGGGSSVGQ